MKSNVTYLAASMKAQHEKIVADEKAAKKAKKMQLIGDIALTACFAVGFVVGAIATAKATSKKTKKNED